MDYYRYKIPRRLALHWLCRARQMSTGSIRARASVNTPTRGLAHMIGRALRVLAVLIDGRPTMELDALSTRALASIRYTVAMQATANMWHAAIQLAFDPSVSTTELRTMLIDEPTVTPAALHPDEEGGEVIEMHSAPANPANPANSAQGDPGAKCP